MNRAALMLPTPPWIVVIDGPSNSVYPFVWRCAADGLTVRVLRGSKMRSEPALFDELGAALQFPDYFGENWPATADCLTDLEWLPAVSGFLLIVTYADQVLADEESRQVDVLARILSSTAEVWATAIDEGGPWDRSAVPFHVVLQVNSAVESLRSRWHAAGELPTLALVP